jgi:uncharacterized coiled-coil protein SlyX
VRRLWVAVVFLGIMLAGMAGYGYFRWEKQAGRLVAVEQALSGLGDRLAVTEATLSQWGSDWNGLVEKVEKLGRRINTSRELARNAEKKAEEWARQTRVALEAALEEQARAMDARLQQLESTEETDRTHLAQLDQQVADVRTEMGSGFDRLEEQLARGQDGAPALSRRMEPNRVDFEIAHEKTKEIVPGISLRLTKTNVSYQRFDGWLWLLADRRTVWVRQRSAQEPVRFYLKKSPEPYELVITDVTRDAAIGYLLVPAATRPVEPGGVGSD